MQISILQGSASGTAVYVETHKPNTNDNGLISLEIGAGTVTSWPNSVKQIDAWIDHYLEENLVENN